MRPSRQGYWSGLPFPSPEDLSNPGIEPGSAALQADSLPTELQGKSWLTGKDLDAGKDWRQKTRGWQRIRWLDGITNSMGMSLSKLREMVKDSEAWVLRFLGSQIVWQNWVTDKIERLNNKTRSHSQLIFKNFFLVLSCLIWEQREAKVCFLWKFLEFSH